MARVFCLLGFIAIVIVGAAISSAQIGGWIPDAICKSVPSENQIEGCKEGCLDIPGATEAPYSVYVISYGYYACDDGNGLCREVGPEYQVCAFVLFYEETGCDIEPYDSTDKIVDECEDDLIL